LPSAVSDTTTNPEPPTPDSTASRDESSRRGPEAERSDTGEPKEWLQPFRELLEYFSYYLSAKADGLRLRGRRALFRVEVELVAVLGAAGAVVAAVTLIARGAAEGLTELFGNRAWLGNLTAGVALLGCVALVMGGWAYWWNKTSRERTIQKYEERKRQQQARFGRNVAGRSASDRDE
jgi:hypothetical protein